MRGEIVGPRTGLLHRYLDPRITQLESVHRLVCEENRRYRPQEQNLEGAIVSRADAARATGNPPAST